ncbi:MAG: hypothetical protein ACD_5C00297G0002 [uncultured bacterium]|nr:MAG: hypothetical protein ACD_5C00297G0002 [uncultured bacterium]
MQKTKKILLVFSIVLSIVLATTSSISASSSWKEYFTFSEMKAMKNETIDSIMSRLEKDPEWKNVISGRNIKNGAITSEKLAPGAFSAINGNIELQGGIITDTTGTVSIGKSGYDAINIFGNTVIDGGLTVNRGLFAKYNITMDSTSAGQQIHITDNTNNVHIGDGDDSIRLAGDTAIDGDFAFFGDEFSVDADVTMSNLIMDSSEGTQRYVTDSEDNVQIGDNDDVVNLSASSAVKFPAAIMGGACSVSGAIGTNPAGNPGERIMVCNGSNWIGN